MRRHVGVVCLALWALSVASCSLLLDWGVEGLACDEDRRCLAGFSCRVNECVTDNSLALGALCNASQQCVSGLVCTPSLYNCDHCEDDFRLTCQRPCLEDNLYSQGDCSAEQFCKPFERRVDPIGDATEIVPICVDSDCAQDGDCSQGRICVQVGGAGQSACLVSCEVTWKTGGVYSDNCGGTLADPRYCQPVGLPGRPARLACLPATTTATPAQGLNQVCKAVTQPCAPGLACLGKCVQHCDADASGPVDPCAALDGADVCCPLARADGGTYGVCFAASACVSVGAAVVGASL